MSDGSLNSFKVIKRKPIRLSQDELIKTGYIDGANSPPLVIEPNVAGVNLATWAGDNRDFIERELLKHGALLFRSFNVKAAEEFRGFIEATSGKVLEYNERSSPRTLVANNIYTSTDYPPDQSIFLHNEQSYNITYPLRIFFYSAMPALRGGETPIADTRKILGRISQEVKEQFISKKYMYVRNFGDGFGLSWQDAFQTTDKTVVEEYCRNNYIEFEWKDGNRLRTRQVRQAVAEHPRTGETVWFNHLTFFHVSTLEPVVRDSLMAQFDEDDLPNNTLYGDGSRIPPRVLDELRRAYNQEEITFRWQEGDILMLDNMLMAHGRKPYEGPRRVLVGMAEPHTWPQL